jgi:ElaB/YqjD/DUF883 family membrane-anchored ribosome-binding protein
MIHRGNGKSHPAPVGLNRIERAAPQVAATPARDIRHTVEDWIAEHPVASIAAAVALGAVLGWIIKRR